MLYAGPASRVLVNKYALCISLCEINITHKFCLDSGDNTTVLLPFIKTSLNTYCHM